MIENALRAKLVATAAVNDLVEGRVWFGVAPQDWDVPHIVLTMITENSPKTFSGSAGYSQGRAQIDCIASTYRGAKDLFEAVKDTLDDFEGELADGLVVDYIELENKRDMPFEVVEGDADPSCYGVSVDAVFQF